MKCFYHNDLDGHAAGFSVYAWVGIHGPHDDDNCMFEINYGTPFPFDIIKSGEQVWIVDYSIQPNEMLRLLDITPDVTWIDHHKTAIERYAGFPRKIRGIRKEGEDAGCVLTWKYLHWWTARGDGAEDFTQTYSEVFPVPRCMVLAGDRDVWAWKYGDETRFFYAGSQLHNTSPDSDFWWKCMDHEIKDLPPPNTGNRDARIRGEKWWAQLLRDGETIERYKAQTDKTINADIGYEVEFEGHRCFACNRAHASSDRFGDRIKKYDILLPHYHDGTHWTVSLYSDVVDVSEIAKVHGGGGHKGAAGFRCDQLPWMAAESTAL